MSYFLPYQLRWIDDRSRLKIIEKSRQIGISFCTAFSAVKRASAQGARLDVWVSSRDEVQARLFIEDCQRWADNIEVVARSCGSQILDAQGSTGYVLRLANGRQIYSLSSNPNALAGKRGHVILDEFALHPDQRLLYRVAKPVTTWGGQLEIISTHRGANSVFNQILRDIKERGNRMGWSHHRVTLQDAVNDGLVERINRKAAQTNDARIEPVNSLPILPLPEGEGRGEGEGGVQTDNDSLRASEHINDPECSPSPLNGTRGEAVRSAHEHFLARTRAECLDEEQWLQEYCCQPCDDSSALLSFEMITACEADCLKDFSYLERCPNPLFLGFDAGRKHNLTVIDVGEKIGDVVWDRLRIEMQNKSFSEQESELYRLLRLPNLRRACIDASGLGMQLAERAREHFGWKIEPVTFTAPIKEQLAYQLRAAFEDQKLRIAPNDKLRHDLCSLRKQLTESGNIRFAGDSDDSHCDRFWAKALRQQAAQYRLDCVGGAVA